mmetsp:Transcript_18054/g.39021  ORF Transcript_18054/g.39021 Transcript_18054/m.39021 type:complete len:396 (-) Transcript_18054:93-1280(-)
MRLRRLYTWLLLAFLACALHQLHTLSTLFYPPTTLLLLKDGSLEHSIIEKNKEQFIVDHYASQSQQNFPYIPSTKRGGGVLTTHSGCRLARWLYTNEGGTRRLFRECRVLPGKQPTNQQLQNSSQLNENDTIFVPFTAIKQFVDVVLDGVSTNVVIISGQTHIVPTVSNAIIAKILDHTHIMHWFCMNLPIYGGVNPHHPKISPFPYGLKEQERHGWNTFDSYKKVLFKSLVNETVTKKTNAIFAGPLGNTQSGRSSIPQTNEELQPEDFFMRMAESKYILSPNGDRPECHRHYEAIGLGTVPITELDPVLFRHLAGGPVIYNNNNNSNWNLTLLEDKLDPNPTVNRNLIREDYWMDWVDNVVGTRLNWNVFENRSSGLTESEEITLALLDRMSF